MKRIELAFQPIAKQIIAGKTSFSVSENEAITRFWELWRQRFKLKHNPQPAIRFPGIDPGLHQLSREQRENLEANGVFFAAENAFLGPQAAGLDLMFRLGPVLSQQAPISWNVIKTDSWDFVVPDTFGDYTFVPISPNLYLSGGARLDSLLDSNTVLEINRLAATQSKDFIFARDLNACFPPGPVTASQVLARNP